jgi:hypothetical protein
VTDAPTHPPPTGSSLDDPLPACLRTVNVANGAALAPAIMASQAGDCLVLADGNYVFPTIAMKSGQVDAPIVIRAQNRLKATVTTGDIILLGSSYIVLEGLSFTSGGRIQFNNTMYSRLTRSRISPTKDRGGVEWVELVGAMTQHNRIDHNDMGPKTAQANIILVSGDEARLQVVQYTRIDHNHFHDVHYGGGNGWETIRAGSSDLAPSKGFITIEDNLFTRASGDPETISVKSSDDIVRYNTFRDTNGQICLRHGNRTMVYGNFLFNSGSGDTGIRIYGADHRIFNNYLEGSGDILLGAGSADGTEERGTEHYRVYRAQVVNNTIVGGGVAVGGGRVPVDSVLANNLIQGGAVGTGGTGTKVMGNITDGAGLAMMGDLFRIAAGSSAIDASTPGFDFVTEDMDGQKRQGVPDVGADELSTDPIANGPLTEKDVGPDAP